MFIIFSLLVLTEFWIFWHTCYSNYRQHFHSVNARETDGQDRDLVEGHTAAMASTLS